MPQHDIGITPTGDSREPAQRTGKLELGPLRLPDSHLSPGEDDRLTSGNYAGAADPGADRTHRRVSYVQEKATASTQPATYDHAADGLRTSERA